MSTEDEPKPPDAPPSPPEGAPEPPPPVREPLTVAAPEPAALAVSGALVVPETRPEPAEHVAPPPASATVADLQSAVGVTPKAKRPLPPPRKPIVDVEVDEVEVEDDLAPRKKRRWPIVVGLSGVVGATIASFILLGRASSESYYLRCSAKHVSAERGRSFPPWGSERLGGAAWKPIAIPPSAECTPRSTDDPVALEGWYLDALVEQATAKLAGASPGDIDLAQAELEQAMLHTRSPERRDQRKELERLLGDVTYWRAAAKVKAAAAELEEAAKRFDDAVARRPRHASDAGAWATLARDTSVLLGRGPGGAGAPSQPPSGVPLPAATRPPAPPGVALPVETPLTAPDAGVSAPDAAHSTLPSGGVLL